MALGDPASTRCPLKRREEGGQAILPAFMGSGHVSVPSAMLGGAERAGTVWRGFPKLPLLTHVSLHPAPYRGLAQFS